MAKAKKSTATTISTSTITAEIAAKFDSIPKKMTKEVVLAFLNAIEQMQAAISALQGRVKVVLPIVGEVDGVSKKTLQCFFYLCQSARNRTFLSRID